MKNKIKSIANEVIDLEINALNKLKSSLNSSFNPNILDSIGDLTISSTLI